LWAGSGATCGKTTISGVSNCLNYCEIFIVYTSFTNVSADCIIPPGNLHADDGPGVGDPYFILSPFVTCSAS
jgi:hypothetical protein